MNHTSIPTDHQLADLLVRWQMLVRIARLRAARGRVPQPPQHWQGVADGLELAIRELQAVLDAGDAASESENP